MLGIYFSGTGNSKYALEVFLKECDEKSGMFSIEDERLLDAIALHETLIFSYPVYYSNIPKIVFDFIVAHKDLWENKKVCPMGNICIKEGKAVSGDKCTMCYRCVNQCPKHAITLLGKKVVEQGTIEKYL